MAGSGTSAVSIVALLFSFQGRISRQPYWLTTIAMIALTILLGSILELGRGSIRPADSGGLDGAQLLLLAAYVPFLWIALAVATKRLHDRGRSAWWLLPFYVLPSILERAGSRAGSLEIVLLLASLALTIWAVVELGFRRGAAGPNAYGADPLGVGAAPQPEWKA
jgi:uncharacterized membrane protein YhaH (DUF805 family)